MVQCLKTSASDKAHASNTFALIQIPIFDIVEHQVIFVNNNFNFNQFLSLEYFHYIVKAMLICSLKPQFNKSASPVC